MLHVQVSGWVLQVEKLCSWLLSLPDLATQTLLSSLPPIRHRALQRAGMEQRWKRNFAARSCPADCSSSWPGDICGSAASAAAPRVHPALPAMAAAHTTEPISDPREVQ